MILVVLISVLVAGGVYLLLDDDPVRLVLGAGLLGHGAVLGLVTVMRTGRPPLVGTGSGAVADPLPQALALTAIVIAFGVAAYLLAFTRVSAGRDVSDQDCEASATEAADASTAATGRSEEAGPFDDGAGAGGAGQTADAQGAVDDQEAAWSG